MANQKARWSIAIKIIRNLLVDFIVAIYPFKAGSNVGDK